LVPSAGSRHVGSAAQWYLASGTIVELKEACPVSGCPSSANLPVLTILRCQERRIDGVSGRSAAGAQRQGAPKSDVLAVHDLPNRSD